MSKVPATGPLNAQIAFVGEAPGAVELRHRTPFVGPTGRLFTQLLEKSGISRNRCYITNVLKDSVNLFPLELKPKTPIMSQEYLDAEEMLRTELLETKANVIVAVGAIALWALCRKKAITKQRGSILESTLLPGRKVVPIIHPSAAFHNYEYQHFITLDLKRVREESRSPELNLLERKMILSPSLDEALEYLHSLHQVPQIAYDIEVVRQELSHIAFAKSPSDVICIPFVDGMKPYFARNQELLVMQEVAKILEDREVEKIAQNTIFDSSFLFRKYGITTWNLQDTMIAQAILAPDFPKGLDFLTSINTREPYYKDDGKQYLKLIGDEMAFRRYNALDAAVTLEIWLVLEENVKRQGNWETYERQRNIIYPLTYMSERGLRLDVEGLKEKYTTTAERLEEITKAIQEITAEYGMPDINIKSTQQLKQYFYTVRGHKPYINRKTGKPTVDEKALKRLSIKGYPVAEHLLEFRTLEKMRSTYYNMSYDEDKRVRCNFNPVGAKSGRLSSSKTIFGTGANLQNQPWEMKKYFLVDEGYLAYEMDYSQAENRVVAYIAPEPKLIQAFEEKVDVHSLTASMIFGEPIDQIIHEDHNKIFCGIGNGKSTKRFWGKKANHSFGYGEGPGRFALDTEIELREAKFIRDSWHRIYPGISEYWRWVREALHKNRTLINAFGRKKTFMGALAGRFKEDTYKEGYSFIPQSTVADAINERGLLYIYNNQELFHGVELLNQVHDSIVFQIPIALGAEYHSRVLTAIQERLVQPMTYHNRTFSIPVDIKVSAINLKDMTELTPENTSEVLEKLCREYTKTG